MKILGENQQSKLKFKLSIRMFVLLSLVIFVPAGISWAGELDDLFDFNKTPFNGTAFKRGENLTNSSVNKPIVLQPVNEIKKVSQNGNNSGMAVTNISNAVYCKNCHPEVPSAQLTAGTINKPTLSTPTTTNTTVNLQPKVSASNIVILSDEDRKSPIGGNVSVNSGARAVYNNTIGTYTVGDKTINATTASFMEVNPQTKQVSWRKDYISPENNSVISQERINGTAYHKTDRSAVTRTLDGWAVYQQVNGTSSVTLNPDGSAYTDTSRREKYDDFVNRTTVRLGETTKVKLYNSEEAVSVSSIVVHKGNIKGYPEQLNGVVTTNGTYIPVTQISKGITSNGEEYDFIIPRTLPSSSLLNAPGKKAEPTSGNAAPLIQGNVVSSATTIQTIAANVTSSNNTAANISAPFLGNSTPAISKNDTIVPAQPNLLMNNSVLGKIKYNFVPEGKFNLDNNLQLVADTKSVYNKNDGTVTSMKVDPSTKQVYWVKENRGQGNTTVAETIKGPVYKELSRTAVQPDSAGWAIYREGTGFSAETRNPDGSAFTDTGKRVKYDDFINQITNKFQDTVKVTLYDGQEVSVQNVVLSKPIVSATGIYEYAERLSGVVTTDGRYIPNSLISTGVTNDGKSYNFVVPKTLLSGGKERGNGL
jgi:hypothetical protein